VDVEDAFANVSLGSADRPYMLFRWYHPDDVDFNGTCHDYVYLHVRGNFGPRPLPYIYTMLQLYVNICAIVVGVSPPPWGFIDDNTTSRANYHDAYESMQLYKKHLRCAGLPDKESKEKLPFQDDIILGRLFNSIKMCISIPPDKLRELESMFLALVASKSQITFKMLESIVGFWEFCLECLPVALSSFAHNTHQWLKQLKKARKSKSTWLYVPRKVKRDVELMLLVTPMCNGTQPLQPMRGKDWCDPLMTDASGKGCGYATKTQAYARKYTCRERKLPICVNEARVVLDALVHNGAEWEGN
jgi:hypothetical protein